MSASASSELTPPSVSTAVQRGSHSGIRAGSLRRAKMRSIRARTWSMSTAVAAVVDAFDHHTTEFRQLAEEWLEEDHVRVRPRLEEAGRAVQAILE